MSPRSYEQFCPLALALDQIGERWTLLVVRELLAAPARFGDIAGALPGVATNLLTKRLRKLEEDGLVIQRALPPPARVSVYELTERGRALEPVVMALVAWGSALMHPSAYKDPANLRGIVLGFRRISGELTRGLRARLNLRVNDECVGIVINDGEFATNYGELQDADTSLTVTYPGLFGLFSGDLNLQDAVKTGAIPCDGSKTGVNALAKVLDRARKAQAVPVG